MGHTIYYTLKIEEWKCAKRFIKRTANGLGLKVREEHEYVILEPMETGVEALILGKNIEGFAKTYGKEPVTSLYLLLLFSLSKFGEVEVWEDE